MKRTIFSPCELRTWLETNQDTIKQAVLAEPLLGRKNSGLNFITDYLEKNRVGYDPGDFDSRRIVAVAATWVSRWRLGYE